MEESKILNTIGIILGLIGVGLIFIWGPPQPKLEEGVGIEVEDNTPIDKSGKTARQYDEEIRSKRRKYNKMSRIGLFLIFLGFVFQLLATWK